MSEQIGKLITCTGCDKTIFLKLTGTAGGSNYTDPGYSRAVYEDLPKTWMYATGIGHLCPYCSEQIVNWLKSYFGEDRYEKFAPCWKIEVEDADEKQ